MIYKISQKVFTFIEKEMEIHYIHIVNIAVVVVAVVKTILYLVQYSNGLPPYIVMTMSPKTLKLGFITL